MFAGIACHCLKQKLDSSGLIPNKGLFFLCNKNSWDGWFRTGAFAPAFSPPTSDLKLAASRKEERTWAKKKKKSLHEALSFYLGIGVLPKDLACI